jgi:hypothetical protein
MFSLFGTLCVKQKAGFISKPGGTEEMMIGN